jgi:class 3 adenylate cyclase
MAETQTSIILVTDLVGSTATRSEVGEDAAEELRRRHDAMLTEAVERHDGVVVKSLGDGILARFGGAATAVACACAMQHASMAGSISASGCRPVM